jgi:hypothetical protein
VERKGEAGKMSMVDSARSVIAAWRNYPAQRREMAQLQPGSPILVAGTHRSGTTWVGQMLTTPGMWHVHEPFNPANGLFGEWFTYAAAGQRLPEVDRIVTAVLQGRIVSSVRMPWIQHPLMPMRLFPQPIHRVLIKEPIGCLLSRYLTAQFGFQTLVLFRHPAAFVASVRTLGWPSQIHLQRLLAQPALMNSTLQPYRGVMERCAESDGLEAAAALHGSLNRVLWQFVEEMPQMTPVCFEDLCADPLESFRELFARFNVPYTPAMRETHQRLCLAESRPQHSAHETVRRSSDMADKWRKQLKADEVRIVEEIWRSFEIPLYCDRKAWPDSEPAVHCG